MLIPNKKDLEIIKDSSSREEAVENYKILRNAIFDSYVSNVDKNFLDFDKAITPAWKMLQKTLKKL